jgi:hypothetical protein
MSIFSSREERIAEADKKIELNKEIGKIYEQHIQKLEEMAEPYKEKNRQIYNMYYWEIVAITRKRGDCIRKQIDLLHKIERLHHYPSWLVWF